MVLNLVDYFEKHPSAVPPYAEWRAEVWFAYKTEMERRKQVSGV
jgi:hypothetical protein